MGWHHLVNRLALFTAFVVVARAEPHTRHVVDRVLTPLSPYAYHYIPNNTRPIVPDYAMFSRACDVQYLGRHVGTWHGWRVTPQVMWVGIGAGGVTALRAVGVSPTWSEGLTLGGINTFTLVRAATLPHYHVDPLGYTASIWTWGTIGTYTASRAASERPWSMRVPLALLDAWVLAYPYGTPTPTSNGATC